MKNIVIVDDSPILRSMIRAVLEHAGYTIVSEAGNGTEAMQKIEQHKPDLVLLDVLMPGESGLDILKSVKALENAPKVMMVTAINQEAVNEEAKTLGANAILYKPFEPEELVKTVKELLAA